MSSQYCCLIILTNLEVKESFVALAFIPTLFLLLSHFPVDIPFSNSMSFTDHIAAHPLKDFKSVVDYPELYTPTDIDDVLSSRTKNGFYVLSGPSGIGKSVALFEHLKKDHVIWLNARHTLCENLDRLDFKVETDDDDECRRVIRHAIFTKRFVLVIDDAQVSSVNSSIFKLYSIYGSTQTGFKVFLIVSDYKLYYQRLHSRLKRNAVEIRVPYPRHEVLAKFRDNLDLSNFEEVLKTTGPSLRLINDYVHDRPLLKPKCMTAKSDLETTFEDIKPILLELTRNFTDDYSSLDLTQFMTKDQFEVLNINTILSGTYMNAYFHDPIIRRAACTLFKDHELSSCNVTLCHQM
ncbi:hypothetical protein GEMRC1_010415 [Eukaryota sp. GEM-RC1]